MRAHFAAQTLGHFCSSPQTPLPQGAHGIIRASGLRELSMPSLKSERTAEVELQCCHIATRRGCRESAPLPEWYAVPSSMLCLILCFVPYLKHVHCGLCSIKACAKPPLSSRYDQEASSASGGKFTLGAMLVCILVLSTIKSNCKSDLTLLLATGTIGCWPFCCSLEALQ